MHNELFKPSNELTFDTVRSDSLRLQKWVQASDKTNLCLDLSEVSQCDSAGLALLIEAKALCVKYNKVFEIKQMPKSIKALAEFCGVDKILMTDVD